jgi:ABC-2 type transport system permease protein
MTSPAPSDPLSPVRHRLRIYRLETLTELRRLVRSPLFLGLTVVSPLLFYVIFKTVLGGQVAYGNTLAHTYMLATYGAFGVAGISLGAVGLTISSERAFGFLTLKRASPMPPEAMLVAKLAVGLQLNVVFVGLLFGLGVAIGGAQLSLGQWFSMGLILVSGTFPFAAFGFAIGYMTRDSRSIAGISNLLHLPLSFVAGLWFPLNMLPRLFQDIAPLLPHYHLAQLGLGRIGASYGGSPWVHAGALIGYGLVFGGLAIAGYKRYRALP